MATDDDDLWPDAEAGHWPEPVDGPPPRAPDDSQPAATASAAEPARRSRSRPELPAPAARREPASQPAEPAAGEPGRGVQLVQELFPGRIISREQLAATEDDDALEVESEGYEHPEADETSPAGPGEDA